MSVKDRVAVITGGGLGLGRVYALALARRGAKVVVNDYGGTLDGKAGKATRAQSVVDEITALGGTAVADHHDVSDREGAKEIIQTAVKVYGTVHILINNAGITGKISPHDDVDADAFMRVIEISVLGSTLVTSVAYKIMAKQRFGRIINVSSNAIYGFGAGGDCAYGASKGATFAITRELGRWSGRDGIKINAVMPSAASRMTEGSEGTRKLAEAYFPAEGVVPFVLVLCSDECPVTGEVFSSSANRAARETLATFPGVNATTPEKFLENFDKVMGKDEEPYLATSTLDHVKYVVRNAHGTEMEDIADFGIANKD